MIPPLPATANDSWSSACGRAAFGRLQIDGWLKEAAPSSELRQWFSHDPAKWPEFRNRYFRELDVNPQAWQMIFDAAAGGGNVTLIYSSHDTEHNNVVALRDYLEKKLEKHRTELRKSDDTPERERPWG